MKTNKALHNKTWKNTEPHFGRINQQEIQKGTTAFKRTAALATFLGGGL